MEIAVIEVHGTSDLKQWVELPNALYRGDVNYIPQILREELAFFRPRRTRRLKFPRPSCFWPEAVNAWWGAYTAPFTRWKPASWDTCEGASGGLRAWRTLMSLLPSWGTWKNGLSLRAAGR